MGGSHTELGFSTVSPGEASVLEPDGKVLGCVVTLRGGKASCEFSHHYLGKEKCPPSPTDLQAPPPTGGSLDQPSQVPDSPNKRSGEKGKWLRVAAFKV